MASWMIRRHSGLMEWAVVFCPAGNFALACEGMETLHVTSLYIFMRSHHCSIRRVAARRRPPYDRKNFPVELGFHCVRCGSGKGESGYRGCRLLQFLRRRNVL